LSSAPLSQILTGNMDGKSCGGEVMDWKHLAVYLHPADKYYRLTRRPSQEQKGLDERPLMASQRPSHPW
jgi:hypothetical protein